MFKYYQIHPLMNLEQFFNTHNETTVITANGLKYKPAWCQDWRKLPVHTVRHWKFGNDIEYTTNLYLLLHKLGIWGSGCAVSPNTYGHRSLQARQRACWGTACSQNHPSTSVFARLSQGIACQAVSQNKGFVKQFMNKVPNEGHMLVRHFSIVSWPIGFMVFIPKGTRKSQ